MIQIIIMKPLKKEYDNLINTGTIELVPYDQIKHIPKSKIITDELKRDY